MGSPNARRTFGRRIRDREQLLLTLSIVPSPLAVELVALAGFDGIIFDMEHGPFTIASVTECLASAEKHGVSTLVRLPYEQRSQIGALLDAGVDGIVVPHISTADMAAEVAGAARFLPVGTRGANPFVRAAGYAGNSSYYAHENERVAVLVQIEGQEGLDNAAAIVAVPGVDAVFAGPVDLSHALGVAGDLENDVVVAAVGAITEEAHAAGVSMAIFCATAEQVASWSRRGVDQTIFGVDAAMILASLHNSVAEARAAQRLGRESADDAARGPTP